MRVATLTTLSRIDDLKNLVTHLESQSVCPDYSVVVDDTQEGDLKTRLGDYKELCHRYVVVRSRNRGRSAALNAGLEEIKDEDLVAIWDSDDHYFPNRIGFLKGVSECAARSDATKIVIQKIIYPSVFGCQARPVDPHASDSDFKLGISRGDSRVAFPSFAFVKNQDTPLFDENLESAVDFAWLSALSEQAFEINVDPNVVGIYNRKSGSISSRKRLAQYLNVMRAKEKRSDLRSVLGLASIIISTPIRRLESMNFVTDKCVKDYCSCMKAKERDSV